MAKRLHLQSYSSTNAKSKCNRLKPLRRNRLKTKLHSYILYYRKINTGLTQHVHTVHTVTHDMYTHT